MATTGTLNKFGALVYSDPSARNNPIVELHKGFKAANGDIVAPFVAFVKFGGKGVKPTKITATVAEIERLVSELTSALADAPSMVYAEEAETPLDA